MNVTQAAMTHAISLWERHAHPLQDRAIITSNTKQPSRLDRYLHWHNRYLRSADGIEFKDGQPIAVHPRSEIDILPRLKAWDS